jgi:hypothetical protein
LIGVDAGVKVTPNIVEISVGGGVGSEGELSVWRNELLKNRRDEGGTGTVKVRDRCPVIAYRNYAWARNVLVATKVGATVFIRPNHVIIGRGVFLRVLVFFVDNDWDTNE